MRARPRVLLTVLAAGGLLTTGALVGVSLDRDEPGRPAAPATTGGGAGPASGARAVAWQGGVLSPATSCDDLLGWYVDRAEELVTPWGWGGGLLDHGFLPRGGIVAEGFAARSQAPTGLSATAADSVGGAMTNATQSETGTNVQEAGVDDWLPHVTTYADNGTSSTRRLLECDEVALPAGPDEAGRVDRIGPGEDIEAVRWFGELALVVTFRQVDPLYTVDLADPTDPRVVGELKIPGYSAYLHPLGPHRLLGLGEGPVSRRGWGAQVGLFDLADLGEPRRLDVLSYRPGTRLVAASDPRAFTWLPGSRTALSVLTRGWGARTGWLSVVRLDDGMLSQELLEVEHGSDVERVRLVRLPDTRVLLVTGDDASFLEL